MDEITRRMPPRDKYIVGPEEGWERNTWYVVEVAYSSVNVVHKCLFFTGFLSKGKPAGYNKLINPTYSEDYDFYNAHYLRVLRKLDIDLEVIT